MGDRAPWGQSCPTLNEENKMNTPVKPSQEINDQGQHRLVCGEQATKWAPYTEFTYLNGYVGVTDYYTGTGECVLTADEFCARMGVGRSAT